MGVTVTVGSAVGVALDASVAEGAERFLARARFDKGTWITVVFAAGIAAWFVLPSPLEWVLAGAGAGMLALAGPALWKGNEERSNLAIAATVIGIAFLIGLSIVWARSELVGATPLETVAMN